MPTAPFPFHLLPSGCEIQAPFPHRDTVQTATSSRDIYSKRHGGAGAAAPDRSSSAQGFRPLTYGDKEGPQMPVTAPVAFSDAWWPPTLPRSWWEHCRVTPGVDSSCPRPYCPALLETVGDGPVLKWPMTPGSLGSCDMDAEPHGPLPAFPWLSPAAQPLSAGPLSPSSTLTQPPLTYPQPPSLCPSACPSYPVI